MKNMIQQILSKRNINEHIKNSHNRVISFSRNNIGLIDLNAELSKGNLILEVELGGKYYIDACTGLKYRFKSNNKSGGPKEGRKELYESLISRMVAKFGKTIEYFPAELDGERGVLCLDWSNNRKIYSTLDIVTKAISLHELENDSQLINRCTKDSIKALKKLPQHFIVGNCDYVPRNVACTGNSFGRISEILYYDYGYSSFSRVESSLIRRNLDINTNNIKKSYLDYIWGYTNSIVGMGPNYNLFDYCYLETVMSDFKDYAEKSQEFKKNIKLSIPIAQDFDEEIRKMRDEGFKIYPDHENIIKQVTDININNYEKIL